MLSFKVNKIQKKKGKREKKDRAEERKGGRKKKGRKTNFIVVTLTTETWLYSTICHSAQKELPKIKVKLDTLKYGFFLL